MQLSSTDDGNLRTITGNCEEYNTNTAQHPSWIPHHYHILMQSRTMCRIDWLALPPGGRPQTQAIESSSSLESTCQKVPVTGQGPAVRLKPPSDTAPTSSTPRRHHLIRQQSTRQQSRCFSRTTCNTARRSRLACTTISAWSLQPAWSSQRIVVSL